MGGKRKLSVPHNPRFGDVLLCPFLAHRQILKDGEIGDGVLRSMPADGHLALVLYLGCVPPGGDVDAEAALNALGWYRKEQA